MLLAATVEVTTDAPVMVPAHLGRATHAALLAVLRRSDPALAAELHNDRPVQPFTTAWLGPRGQVPAGEQGLVRWTALTEPLARTLRDVLLPSLPAQLDLAGTLWRVTGWSVGARGDRGWAGVTSCAEVARRFLLHPRPPPLRLALAFATPTTFHSEGKSVPLPLPRLVFGSLLARWNAVAALQLREEVVAYAEQALAISNYALQSQLVTLGKGRQVAFTGHCTYTALGPPAGPRRDGYALRALHLLAAFAFYAGVGAKTTQGMGQVHPF